jgi:hypothetical protein
MRTSALIAIRAEVFLFARPLIDQVAPQAAAEVFTDERPLFPGNDAAIQPQVFACKWVDFLGQGLNAIFLIVAASIEVPFVIVQLLPAHVFRRTVNQAAFAAAIGAQVFIAIFRDRYPSGSLLAR